MRQLRVRCWLLLLLLVAVCGPVRAAVAVEHWVQPSGAQVFLVQSHGLPMVDVQIDFDAGARRDPLDKAGLASVTAAMAGRGVRADGDAPALDENALGEAWADLGASFGASAGNDRMGFALRTLTDPELLPRAVALAARQLAQPAFPEAVWQREREQLAAAIREADTRAPSLASRAFAAAVYGTHPYGYRMTEATLAAIAPADMQALYRRAIVPCRAKVSVVGAVSRDQADQLVLRLLGRLDGAAAARCPALEPVAEVAPLQPPGVTRSIAFAAAAQAQILVGQPGIRRDDPDFLALTVGNYVLGGGGFVSRLMTQLRERRGLTYGVYSQFAPGLHAGAFTIGLQTRPDQAAQAVALVHEIVQRFVREGPSEQELQAAKSNLVGGFALRLDSNRKLLDNLANIAWHGLPLDYLDTWSSAVERLTVAQVRAAFARAVQPQAMVTVVVGARAVAP